MTNQLALLNTSILTSEGNFTLETITLEEAQNLITNNKDNIISAIGHQSTADIMSTLLDVNINMNRIQFKQEVNQQALIFKLRGRPEEGRILKVSDIEQIGYDFQVLTMNKLNK